MAGGNIAVVGGFSGPAGESIWVPGQSQGINGSNHNSGGWLARGNMVAYGSGRR